MLGALFNFEFYSAGHVIFRQADEGDKFYIIVNGIVDLTLDIEDQSNQIQTIALNALHNNDYFGEIALMENQKRMATATCREVLLLFYILLTM